MNKQDHISESFETTFWVKILKFFDVDPGSGMEKIRIRDKHPGSATLKIIEAVPVVRGEGSQDRVHRQGKVGLCELKEKYIKKLRKKI